MNPMQREAIGAPHPGFSTESLGAEQWRDIVCSFYSGLSIDWVLDQPGPSWLGLSRFADTQVMEIASRRPVRVVSSPSLAGFNGTYNLALLAAGNCRSRHAGHEEVWQVGDLMLFDGDQSFDVYHPGEYHLISWNLPREAVSNMLAEPERSTGLRIAGDSGPGAVLGNYIRTLLDEVSHLDPRTQDGMLTHLYGLIGLALGGSPAAKEARSRVARAVRRQQVLTYIRARWHDPHLNIQQAARDLQISPRWIQALLEEDGVSFATRVTDRRLEECKKLLTGSAYDNLTIADIAYRSGFSNLSTFNRRFREKYEMSPREARRAKGTSA